MKKCPYCGSNIEDNAQFCFHCMKELKKKSVINNGKFFSLNAKIVISVAASLAAALICVILVIHFSKSKMPELSNSDSNIQTSFEYTHENSDFSEDSNNNYIYNHSSDKISGESNDKIVVESDASTANTSNNKTNSLLSSSTTNNSTSSNKTNTASTDSSKTNSSVNNSTIKNTANSNKTNTNSTGSAKNSTTTSNTTTSKTNTSANNSVAKDTVTSITTPSKPNSSSSSTATNSTYTSSTTTSSTDHINSSSSSSASNNTTSDNTSNSNSNTTSANPTHQTITYSYRTATALDVNQAVIYGNYYTITDVETVAEDGVYIIPEEINGVKVVSIATNAFCKEQIAKTVKKVVIPSSVRLLQDYSFSKCTNLTDIYFCGNIIDAYYSAFLKSYYSDELCSNFTVHCSKECRDSLFRKYSSSNYEYPYQEWDGVIDF